LPAVTVASAPLWEASLAIEPTPLPLAVFKVRVKAKVRATSVAAAESRSAIPMATLLITSNSTSNSKGIITIQLVEVTETPSSTVVMMTGTDMRTGTGMMTEVMAIHAAAAVVAMGAMSSPPEHAGITVESGHQAGMPITAGPMRDATMRHLQVVVGAMLG